MKVSIGYRLQDGPWGGGNSFGMTLKQYLTDHGVQVVHDLQDSDLDAILLTEPDGTLRSSAFTHREVLRYLLRRNSRAVVVHRINNTSEARDDPAKTFNRYRVDANRVADFTAFVSEWVHQRYVESGFRSQRYRVIHNGGDPRIWYPNNEKRWKHGRLKIVTHHWSVNPKKGFDLYRKLDTLLEQPAWSSKIAFTYVGRLPDGFRFKNARHVGALSGEALAHELRQHSVYLTASVCESGPMHCIEGGLSGLPILYIRSGATPEYCGGFGVGFTIETFESALQEMIVRYSELEARMPEYPFTAERMCRSYEDLIRQLVGRRNQVRRQRQWWQQPFWLTRTLLGPQ